MPVTTLNLGILAHVDAGKTTLTERLLYAAGAIDDIGSVDAGTTRTDSLELERRRGITIRSAVASFTVGDAIVNLIDTPGHPDFIAEVERVLSVLDGAVLVVSAVEGVQPQTRVLMRALQRLRVPTLLFVNKIDRAGADPERVLTAISTRLSARVVAMGSVDGAGTRDARFRPFGPDDPASRSALLEVLAGGSDALLAAYVEDERRVTYRRLRAELAAQSGRAAAHPVFFGSAITGAGVDALMSGLVELLPAAGGDAAAPVSGSVFKIERGAAGEKVAYARLFAGSVRVRDRLPIRDGVEGKVTAISVFDNGTWARRDEVRAGEIGKLWGLAEVQVGDAVGRPPRPVAEHHFAPPTLEASIRPDRPEDGAALRTALGRLAEQDPLIGVRRDDRQELSVSLYGEVQKEVVQSTLADEYGIAVTFHETTVIHVERPVRSGTATEILHAEGNPYNATIGLCIEPAPVDSGVEFRLAVIARTVPMYVYKSVDNFAASMEQYVRDALEEGLRGWRVTDCVVTMVESNYSSPDGPPATRGPLSTAADFRKLTPTVVMRALQTAGTVVCEPTVRVTVDTPAETVGPVLNALGRMGASVRTRPAREGLFTVETLLPAARVHELQRDLPNLTGGEGVLETRFTGYRPVLGDPPTRYRRTDVPLP